MLQRKDRDLLGFALCLFKALPTEEMGWDDLLCYYLMPALHPQFYPKKGFGEGDDESRIHDSQLAVVIGHLPYKAL
jgi:hypothetical protein